MARLTDFRCISLDRPGTGFSDGVDFLEVDERQLAVDVLQAVLDVAEVGDASFVANSMGGWWTLQLAMQVPARVSRMILMGCPAVILNTSAPFPMRLISVPILGRHMVKSIGPASPAKARELPTFLGHALEVGERWPQVKAEIAYAFARLPDVQRSWSTLLRRFLRPWGSNRQMRISAGELRGITQPTLFVWGQDDPFGSPDAGRVATSVMSDARLAVVGRGHNPWWDVPDGCARVVREFVRTSQ